MHRIKHIAIVSVVAILAGCASAPESKIQKKAGYIDGYSEFKPMPVKTEIAGTTGIQTAEFAISSIFAFFIPAPLNAIPFNLSKMLGKDMANDKLISQIAGNVTRVKVKSVMPASEAGLYKLPDDLKSLQVAQIDLGAGMATSDMKVFIPIELLVKEGDIVDFVMISDKQVLLDDKQFSWNIHAPVVVGVYCSKCVSKLGVVGAHAEIAHINVADMHLSTTQL